MHIPIIGQISASLTSFSRTIDDYSELAKRELIPAKQEKAHERIKTFRAELLEYRQYLDRLKKDREDTVSSALIVSRPIFLLNCSKCLLKTKCSIPYTDTTLSPPPLRNLANNPQPYRAPRPPPTPHLHSWKPLRSIPASLNKPAIFCIQRGARNLPLLRHFPCWSHSWSACPSRAILHGIDQCSIGRISRAWPRSTRRFGPAKGNAQRHSEKTLYRCEYVGCQWGYNPYGGEEGEAGQVDILGRSSDFLPLLLARYSLPTIEVGSDAAIVLCLFRFFYISAGVGGSIIKVLGYLYRPERTLAFLDNCFQSEKGSFSQAMVWLQRTWVTFFFERANQQRSRHSVARPCSYPPDSSPPSTSFFLFSYSRQVASRVHKIRRSHG